VSLTSIGSRHGSSLATNVIVCNAEQASRYSGFAEYAKRTEGVRFIPVLELTKV
jgi:hypothetical protein